MPNVLADSQTQIMGKLAADFKFKNKKGVHRLLTSDISYLTVKQMN